MPIFKLMSNETPSFTSRKKIQEPDFELLFDNKGTLSRGKRFHLKCRNKKCFSHLKIVPKTNKQQLHRNFPKQKKPQLLIVVSFNSLYVVKRNQNKKLHGNGGFPKTLKRMQLSFSSTEYLSKLSVRKTKVGGGPMVEQLPYYRPLNSMPVSQVKFSNITSEVTISAMSVLPDGCS